MSAGNSRDVLIFTELLELPLEGRPAHLERAAGVNDVLTTIAAPRKR